MVIRLTMHGCLTMIGTNRLNHISLKSKELHVLLQCAKLLSNQTKLNFLQRNVFITDSTFFDVFDVSFTQGGKDNFITTINSVVISQTVADRLFPGKSPLGKMLQLSGEFETKMHDYQIVGVIKPMPHHSHFHADILVNSSDKGFFFTSYFYVLLKKGSDFKNIVNQFDNFKNTHIKKEQSQYFTLQLQPVTQIHLFSNKDREIEMNGDIKTVWLFILIGIGILVIASLNSINLNIASYLKRSRNFTITRYFGGQKINIFLLLLVESIILGFIVLLISLFLFNPITDLLRSLESFKTQSFENTSFLLITSFILFLILILAGTYPALHFNSTNRSSLSNFGTVAYTVHNRLYFSKLMLIVQFSLSVILIIGAITIRKQNQLAFTNRVTQDNSDILVLKNLNWEVKPLYQKLKEELLRSSLITDVTATMTEPSFDDKDVFNLKDGDLKPEKKKLALHMLVCDDNLIDFFNLKLIAGESFPKYIPKQTFESYILNEDATKYLGFNSPEEAIGKRLSFWFDTDSILFGGKIVGVVKDFHYATLHKEIRPLVMFQQPIWYWTFMIKINSKDKDQALRFINSTWQKIYPDYPFDYISLDDQYDQAYSKEINESRVVTLFSIIGLLIACIGLICLTSYITETRTKEIGIRRVNGAKVTEVLMMLNKSFAKWVIISIVVAIPIAWYGMNRWLQNFAYKTELSWWIFVLAGIIAISIALVTISWQSWKAATRNPVEALRYE